MKTDIEEMEIGLAGIGLRVSEFCRECDIARSTWDRWRRAETLPNMRTWRHVRATYRLALESARTRCQERDGAA